MLIQFDDRESDSPYVERVWRSWSRHGGSFLSMAESNIELVVTRLPGFLAVTLRGTVSQGSLVECPPNGEWLAIRFRLGTYLPKIPTASLIDHQTEMLFHRREIAVVVQQRVMMLDAERADDDVGCLAHRDA